jgi:hypothetical protein
MELTTTRVATNCVATQKLARILWQPEARFRIHNSPTLVLILSQTNPRFILISYCYLRLGLPSGIFLSHLPTNNLHAFLFSPIRATYSDQLILLHLIILIMLGEGHSHKVPHYAALVNLLSLHLSLVQIFSWTLSSQTPSIYVTPSV